MELHVYVFHRMYAVQGKYLVSVGGCMYLWNWRSGELITKLQATSSCSTVSSVSFSSHAKFIVTAGKKHLKFWAIGSSRRTLRNGGKSGTVRKAPLSIPEKLVNLSIHKESSFTSIASFVWSSSSNDNCKQAGDVFPIYTLTDSGSRTFALSTSRKLIACACNSGTVQLYTPAYLEYVGSILYSKAQKFYEENNTVYHVVAPEQDIQQLPTLLDVVACQFSALEKPVVIYRDHSL